MKTPPNKTKLISRMSKHPGRFLLAISHNQCGAFSRLFLSPRKLQYWSNRTFKRRLLPQTRKHKNNHHIIIPAFIAFLNQSSFDSSKTTVCILDAARLQASQPHLCHLLAEPFAFIFESFQLAAKLLSNREHDAFSLLSCSWYLTHSTLHVLLVRWRGSHIIEVTLRLEVRHWSHNTTNVLAVGYNTPHAHHTPTQPINLENLDEHNNNNCSSRCPVWCQKFFLLFVTLFHQNKSDQSPQNKPLTLASNEKRY